MYLDKSNDKYKVFKPDGHFLNVKKNHNKNIFLKKIRIFQSIFKQFYIFNKILTKF